MLHYLLNTEHFYSNTLALIDLWLQDKLESVLDLSHQQMEQYQEQPTHAQKIAYQQRLLQEDLVTIRAQISRLSTVCILYILCNLEEFG